MRIALTADQGAFMTERLDYTRAAPDGMKAFGGVHSYVDKCGLPKPLINLVYLRVSLINGCAYCIDMHSRDLLKGGMPAEKLALVPVWFEAEDLFSERERAALAWAETVTHVADTHIPDDAYAAAKSVFSDKELADLTIAIGLMNAYNRLAIGFRATPLAVVHGVSATA
jgi:AhpD family alkylhydroperoxidase